MNRHIKKSPDRALFIYINMNTFATTVAEIIAEKLNITVINTKLGFILRSYMYTIAKSGMVIANMHRIINV